MSTYLSFNTGAIYVYILDLFLTIVMILYCKIRKFSLCQDFCNTYALNKGILDDKQ